MDAASVPIRPSTPTDVHARAGTRPSGPIHSRFAILDRSHRQWCASGDENELSSSCQGRLYTFNFQNRQCSGSAFTKRRMTAEGMCCLRFSYVMAFLRGWIATAWQSVRQSRAPCARAGAFPRVQAALAERRPWRSVTRADDPRIFPVGRGRLGSMRWAAIATAERCNRRI